MDACLASAPLRTLHHFACTGGTLIARCIAALPDVQLLSEVDPLSTVMVDASPRFTPTDMVALLRNSPRGSSPALELELFQAQIPVLQRHAARQGWALVLRDHAHSHFCFGAQVAERPCLREMIPAGVPLLSLVTVRHPLDSLASLQANDWLHFSPRSVDEYCRRYHQFLDRHAGVPVLRYEEFVAMPRLAMQRIAEMLALRYDPGFAQRFGAVRLSGDSGRSGQAIAPRPSQPRALALQDEAVHSAAYLELINRLHYGQQAGEVLE